MTRPLFEVGEEVIFESKNYPHYNGEYVVQGVISGEEHLLLGYERGVGFGGKVHPYYCDLGITLNLILMGATTDEKWDYVPEASLRKKHKPSEGSFSSLISNLREGTLEGIA